MAQDVILDRKSDDPSVNVFEGLRTAALRHRKSITSQLSDIIKLSFSKNKISPEEYYYYNLYKDDVYSEEEKRKFLGKNAQTSIYLLCNTPTWWFIAHDKLAFYGLMQGLGLPVPEIRAVLHPFRCFGSAKVLTGEAEVGAWLTDPATRFPLFGKPVAGMWSEGISALDSVAATARTLRLSDGRVVPLDDYAREVARYGEEGYLFQERLVPHPAIAALCGDRISTVRLVIIVTEAGPEILRAVWKIPAGRNMADNFWRPGNLLADIEAETGVARRVVRGVGPDQASVESHPDTGGRLAGARLPDWQQLTALCLTAAASLPALRLQAWDVAMCDRGPVLLELNIGGDFNLPQVASGHGLLDERFRQFLASCQAGEGGFWARYSRKRIARAAGSF